MNPSHAPDIADLREPTSWRVTKHVVQLAVAGAGVLVVVAGGSRPLMALCWAGAALIAMCALAIVDRQRFVEAGVELAQMEVVEVIGPMHAPLTLDRPVPRYEPAPEAPFLAHVT